MALANDDFLDAAIIAVKRAPVAVAVELKCIFPLSLAYL